MIGLVNSAGATQTARAESVDRSVRERAVEQKNELAPLLAGESAAYRVLSSAIKAMKKMVPPSADRQAPTGEQSDRFAQAELEQGASTLTAGAHLDVVA